MTSEPSDSTTDTVQSDDVIEAANSLIGIEELWSGRILYTGVELGLFELLSEDPSAARDLADELDLHPDNTYRLLRALAHYGVLDENENRGFALTPMGALFQADHPDSLQKDLAFNRGPEWALTMLHMPVIVKEGGPNGFVREFDCEFYEYLEENPEFGSACNAVMESASRPHLNQILDFLEGYDVSQFSQVCDVGGGHGRLLCHILQDYPHLHGTVLELPSVLAEEDQLWAPKLKVTDRCSYVPGDMFEEVPEADAYVLKWILHNWSDDDCLEILSTIHDAGPPDSRLFIVETVVPGPDTSHFAKRLDITMMVQVGGRERTKEEYTSLLEQTGWDFVEMWDPGEGVMSVLEATKT